MNLYESRNIAFLTITQLIHRSLHRACYRHTLRTTYLYEGIMPGLVLPSNLGLIHTSATLSSCFDKTHPKRAIHQQSVFFSCQAPTVSHIFLSHECVKVHSQLLSVKSSDKRYKQSNWWRLNQAFASKIVPKTRSERLLIHIVFCLLFVKNP